MINQPKLNQLAEIIDGIALAERDFTGESMPEVDQYVDQIPYFFAFTALQMCGTGRKSKGEAGCSKIWRHYYQLWCDDRSFFDPAVAQDLSHADMARVFDFSRDGKWMSDKDIYWRWQLHRGLGRHIASIEDFSFASTRIADLEGYNFDPFEKKANLLRMILTSRPEKFLEDDRHGPIIDYHTMRVLARTGAIQYTPVDPSDENANLHERQMRESAFSAVVNLEMLAGKTHNQLDTLFWTTGRQVCRRSVVRCEHCPFDSICENRSALEIRVDTINY